MGSIAGGRNVADVEGDLVIYISGMRLNRLRSFPQWIAAGRKLAEMFDRLEGDPESGFLGYLPAFVGLRTGAAIQYWRSLADLRRFAHDREDLHVPAWTWYEQEVDAAGGVGFWAELYVVEDGSYETFYRNVHPIGLGTVGGLVPATARERRLDLSRDGDPPERTGDEPASDRVGDR